MVIEAKVLAEAKVVGSPTVHHILQAYALDESLGFIVYAPRGYGKSSWSFQVGSKVIGRESEPEWGDRLKKWTWFTPQEFCDIITHTYHKTILGIWEDAGYWLNRLFWYDEFVREALRYMTLQRSQFGALIFSTPSLQLLPNKILELEDVLRVKIYKQDKYGNPQTDQHSPDRPRCAVVKRPWYSDDMRKHGVSMAWSENFSAFMPDDFYKWYKPVREGYVKMAAIRIQEAINKSRNASMKMKLEKVEEEIGVSIPDRENVADMKEVVDQLEAEGKI
jgi:hypothetical protein